MGEAGSREGLRADGPCVCGRETFTSACMDVPTPGDFRRGHGYALGDTQEPRPDPLDVERLEKALLLHAGEFIEQPESFDSRRLVAENIAAIYARLAAASPAAPETARDE